MLIWLINPNKAKAVYVAATKWGKKYSLPVHVWVKFKGTIFNPEHPEFTEVYNPNPDDYVTQCPTCKGPVGFADTYSIKIFLESEL